MAETKKDLELGNGDSKRLNEKDAEESDDDLEEEVKEPCCSKERILRMVVFLFISIANKVIAIRMIKKGAHKADECPAADAIPQFLLVLGVTFMVMFVLTIFRNITLWPCFPKKLDKYARVYRIFQHYFVDYFLNLFVIVTIVAFSIVVWSNYRPEFEDPEHHEYCSKDIYQMSAFVLIISYVVIAGYVAIFAFKEWRRRKAAKEEINAIKQ